MNEELIDKIIAILNERGSHDWNRLSVEEKKRIVKDYILTDDALNDFVQ